MVDSPGNRSFRRFALNPLEAIVFAGIFGVFGTSVYRLFESGGDSMSNTLSLRENARRMQEARSIAGAPETPDSREAVPAVFEAAIAALNVDCRDAKVQDTSAERIRLEGIFCAENDRGPASSSETAPGAEPRTVIVNRANAFTATLFTLPESGQYLTDYIPLEIGENRLHFEFHSKKGKAVSFERTVVRKTAAAAQ